MVTRATVLTSSGRGAVAVVRVWGPLALETADAVFRPNRGEPLSRTPPGRPRVGRVGAGLGDEVVALIEAGEPPEVEIQCHGGSAAVSLVLEALEAAGAVRSRPFRWIRSRAATRIQAEAAYLLAYASTIKVAEVLMDQADGALDRVIAEGRADAASSHARLGLRLISGFRVVLAGRPNVGKSRLLNALAGYERAIVAPTPGTTRDVVTTTTAFDGWPVELADTAGLRTAPDAIEARGVELARSTQATADLVILVLDRSERATEEDLALIGRYPDALVVANKSDLPPAWNPPGMSISAERGDGIDALPAEIAKRLVPTPPGPGDPVPFRPWQVRLLSTRR